MARIAVPAGRFHQGAAAEYVCRAFRAASHAAEILNARELREAFAQDAYDLYFCVDSGTALDLGDDLFRGARMSRLAFWFIDYRHNRARAERNPPDAVTAKIVSGEGGWVFQSQLEDLEAMRDEGIERGSWLPLAADPDIWSPSPGAAKQFDYAFTGNIWDTQRVAALNALKSSGVRLGLAVNGELWKQRAARLISSAHAGFNVSSFFGSPIAFDVNMRAFETLSCGAPLLTNSVPNLSRVFPEHAPWIRTYQGLDDLSDRARAALADPEFLQSGVAAREWILANATYEHRIRHALEIMRRETGELLEPELSHKHRAIVIDLGSLSRHFTSVGWQLEAREHALHAPGNGVVHDISIDTRAGTRLVPVSVVRHAVSLGAPGVLVTPQSTILKESVFYPSVTLQLPSSGTISLQYRDIAEGHYLPLNGMWADSYWHWINEYLVRLVLAERAGFAGHVLLTPRAPRFQRDSLAMCGVGPDRQVPCGETPLGVSNLWVPGVLQGSREVLESPGLLAVIRERCLAALPRTLPGDMPRRVYVSRQRSTRGRRVLNAPELNELLGRFEFKEMFLEELSFPSQVALFSHAEAIVGPHGAGIANTLFLPRGALVCELFAPRFVHPCMPVATELAGLRHFSIVRGESIKLDPSIEAQANLDDVDVDIHRLAEILERELRDGGTR